MVSEREVLLKILELKHSEERILFQLLISGCITISAAVIVAIVRYNFSIISAISVITWIFVFGVFAYKNSKKRMNKLCNNYYKKIKGVK